MKTSIIKKITFAVLFTFPLFFSTLIAQNDTMYIMKNGAIVRKFNVLVEIDSILFHPPIIEDTMRGTFTDARDNTVYNWVKIGNQVWMEENLKYLPSVVGLGTTSQITPYYYVYDYIGTDVNVAKTRNNYVTYGVLYNWAAAMAGSLSSSINPSGVQGVCPTGWHLPSDAEWTQLENYLADNAYNYDGSIGGGGDKIAKALSSPNSWISSSIIGSVGNTDYPIYRNKSGFTALPGGCLSSGGTFGSIGYYGYWWCATEVTEVLVWCRDINYNSCSVYRNFINKETGYSVRCVRD